MNKTYVQNIVVCLYAIASSLLVMYNLLGERLFSLNAVQWDQSGDGFKNYFNFAYHYKHGGGFYTKGMLYPYGDFLAYGDAQTSILMFFKMLKSLGLDITGHELFVVQSLPIFFMALGVILMVKVFRHYKVPVLYSCIFSFLICFLSPQLYRIQSHYSLSYLAIFPGIWLWYLHLSKQKLISKFLFSFVLVFIGFIHPYLILMLGLFLISYFFVQYILTRKINSREILFVILGLVCFFILTSYFDTITDRPANPWGAGMFKTELSDLFPFYGWFHELFSYPLRLRTEFHEGYCWLGILILVFPFWFIYLKIKALKPIYLPMTLKHSAIAALLVMMFAMGIHLLFFNNLLGDIFPFLKQFRGLGRFSWPFYYVGSTVLFYYFYEFTKEKKYFKPLVLLLSLIYLLDTYHYHQKIAENISHYDSDNLLNRKDELDDFIISNNIKPEQYQAILTLPSGTEGAEKLYLKHDWLSKNKSLHLAYKLGLPTTNIVMSRVSLSQCLKINQIVSSDYIEKDILNDLVSDKPFLTMVNKADTSLFRNVLNKSKLIGVVSDLAIYDTPLSKLEETTKVKQEVVDSLKNNMPLFYDDFENHSCSNGLHSKKSLCFNGSYLIMDHILDSIEMSNLDFSIWYKIQTDHSTVPIFKIECRSEHNVILLNEDYRDFHFKQVEIIGMWVRIKKSIKLPNETHRIVWRTEGAYQIMDHALVAATDAEFVVPINDTMVIYNHHIAEKK